MNLPHTVVRCRTLVIEGPDAIGRAGLACELARHGFMIRRSSGHLHHVDPTQPYRQLLAGPGRIVVDGSIIRELVYGPLLHGRSRVTWIQALDFAEAVAERDGALLHLTSIPPGGQGAQDPEEAAAVTAFERAFSTLAQHVPVITVDVGELGHGIRALAAFCPQQRSIEGKLTVG